MIIKSTVKRNVGDVVRNMGLTDHNGTPHFVPFKIMDIVTREDYLRVCKEEKLPVGHIFENDNFYLISVD